MAYNILSRDSVQILADHLDSLKDVESTLLDRLTDTDWEQYGVWKDAYDRTQDDCIAELCRCVGDATASCVSVVNI